MAKQWQLKITDDLDAAEGRATEAAETLTLGLDGVTVDLDLTADHAAELRKLAAPYLAAGQRHGTGTAKAAAPVVRGPGARQSAMMYNRGMRKFADVHGYEYKRHGAGNNAHPAYYYPQELRDAYAAWLAEHPEGMPPG